MNYHGPALIKVAEIVEIQRFWATFINVDVNVDADAGTTIEGEC